MPIREYYASRLKELQNGATCRHKEAVIGFLDGTKNPADLTTQQLYTIVNDIVMPAVRDTSLKKEAEEQIDFLERLLEKKKKFPAA